MNLRILFTAAALLASVGPAPAFTLDQQPGKVGSRDGQALNGYWNLNGSPLWAGTPLDDAQKAIGPGVLRQSCKLGNETVPCLIQQMIKPPLKAANVYYFPGNRFRFVVAYVMPFDGDTWFGTPADYVGLPEAYCDAMAGKLYHFIRAEAGELEAGMPEGWKEESERFPTQSTTAGAAIKKRGGFNTLTKVMRFTFPKGGDILLERTFNTDDQECQARAIYHFAEGGPKMCVNNYGVWADDCD